MQTLKKNTDKTLKYNFNCLFSTNPLVYGKIFADQYYSPEYFPRTGTMG